MKKLIISILVVGCSVLGSLKVLSFNVDEQIEPENIATMSAACQKFFAVADDLIDDAERSNISGEKITNFKSVIESNKVKIIKLAREEQEKYCLSGVEVLKSLK